MHYDVFPYRVAVHFVQRPNLLYLDLLRFYLDDVVQVELLIAFAVDDVFIYFPSDNVLIAGGVEHFERVPSCNPQGNEGKNVLNTGFLHSTSSICHVFVAGLGLFFQGESEVYFNYFTFLHVNQFRVVLMGHNVKVALQLNVFVIQGFYLVIQELLVALEKVDHFVPNLWDEQVCPLRHCVLLK